jgi:hypothetical protein
LEVVVLFIVYVREKRREYLILPEIRNGAFVFGIRRPIPQKTSSLFEKVGNLLMVVSLISSCRWVFRIFNIDSKVNAGNPYCLKFSSLGLAFQQQRLFSCIGGQATVP